MGLISMCSLRSLTPPPPTPTPKTTQLQTLCYHTHTQKALSGDCLGQWCDTDIRADTSAISQKPKHPEIHFNARVGLRSVIVPAVDRVITATHTVSLFPQIILFYSVFHQQTSFLLNFVLILNRLSSLYLLCIYFIFTFYFLFDVYLLPPQHLFCIIIICVSTFCLVFTVYQCCVYFPLFIYFVLSFLCLFCIFSPLLSCI